MSEADESIITLEEVLKTLSEIESKYETHNYEAGDGCNNEEFLFILSKEFDMLGLPMIDFSQSLHNKLQQVVSTSRMLVQVHRTMVNEMRDVNLNCRSKETKCEELRKKMEELRRKLKQSEDKNQDLKNKIIVHGGQYNQVQAKVNTMKEELDRTKRFYSSKVKELEHNIKKLNIENMKMKEKIGEEIGTYHSRDDNVIKLLKKFKSNEEVYKTTIQKLQENNQKLLEECILLKQ